MNTLVLRICLILTAWPIWIDCAQGQRATEVYIPIGKSPGVSSSRSLIGIIEHVDYAARSMTIRGPDGTRTISMHDLTRYFLDRSKRQQSNSEGSLADCEVGRTVEVKVAANGEVDWVKIEAS